MADRQVELLEEAVKWLRLLGIQEAQEVIRDALEHKDEKRENAAKIVYQLSNGENSTKEIARHIDYSYRWVSYRQQEWANLGIVNKDSPQAPYRHVISLDDLGIDYPNIQMEG